jgi:tRNA G18 (ribose-2'-O)-methylase SpoU
LIISVTDPLDPRVAPFRDVRDRDVAGRRGGFIAEGEVVLNVLARSRLHRAEALLISQARIERLSALIDAFPASVPVYSAGQAVMDAIVGFPIHRGVLAVGRREAEPSPEALLERAPPRAVVLALSGVSNHDNIGGIFRNAAAFGVHGVFIDGACCDPLYRKAIRVSVGAALIVPFARLAKGTDVIDLMTRHGFSSLALTPSGGTPLASLPPQSRVAVLLGAEGPGLPAAILARARTVAVPMAGDLDSINVATTSGIVLHHLASNGPLGS